jgi:hypothetical protein
MIKRKSDWYIPNTESLDPMGPFEHDQIVQMLAKGDLRFDDYIWNPSLQPGLQERWFRLYEVADFAAYQSKYPKCKFPKKRSQGTTSVKKFKIPSIEDGHENSDKETGIQHQNQHAIKNEFLSEVGAQSPMNTGSVENSVATNLAGKISAKKQQDFQNDYRRYPRAPLQGKAIIHNQYQYTSADIIDISEKGVYTILEELDIFKLGEEVSLTIVDHDSLGTFSVKSVIINSRIQNKKQGYGVYFLHVNPSLKRKIVEYVVNRLTGGKNRADAA